MNFVFFEIENHGTKSREETQKHFTTLKFWDQFFPDNWRLLYFAWFFFHKFSHTKFKIMHFTAQVYWNELLSVFHSLYQPSKLYSWTRRSNYFPTYLTLYYSRAQLSILRCYAKNETVSPPERWGSTTILLFEWFVLRGKIPRDTK